MLQWDNTCCGLFCIWTWIWMSKQCLVKPFSQPFLLFLFTPWALSWICSTFKVLLLTAFDLPFPFLVVSSLIYFFVIVFPFHPFLPLCLRFIEAPWFKCFTTLYNGLSMVRSSFSFSLFPNRTSFLGRLYSHQYSFSERFILITLWPCQSGFEGQPIWAPLNPPPPSPNPNTDFS